MSDIFISYAREDREIAASIAGILESEGFSVWWDRVIPAGRIFDDVIEEAIKESKCVFVLWSKSSIDSKWVKIEAAEGANRDILVPVKIENVSLPMRFSHYHTEDLIGWNKKETDHRFQKLLSDINKLIGRAGTKASMQHSNEETEVSVQNVAQKQDSTQVYKISGRHLKTWGSWIVIVLLLIVGGYYGYQASVRTSLKDQLNNAWKSEVYEVCSKNIRSYYPFYGSKNKPDIPLDDFATLFGDNGVIQEYIKERLNPGGLSFSRDGQLKKNELDIMLTDKAKLMFRSANHIKNAFFQDEELPYVKFQVKPTSLDAGLRQIELDIHGQKLIYSHGPIRSSTMTWPGVEQQSVRIMMESVNEKGTRYGRTLVGQWALMRLLDEAKISPVSSALDRYLMKVDVDNYTAKFTIRFNSVWNMITARSALQSFRCVPDIIR